MPTIDEQAAELRGLAEKRYAAPANLILAVLDDRERLKAELAEAKSQLENAHANMDATMQGWDALCARSDKADEECVRLREALRRISGFQLGEANGVPENRLDPLSGAQCVHIARAALNPTPETT